MSRLRRQDGFTLPELLIGITMAMIVMLAAFALLETALRRTGETQARVEATQRGRQAIDVMTRALRSQVCIPAEQLGPSVHTAQPAIAQATPTSVTFFTDLSDGGGTFAQRVEKRVLTYDPAKKLITEARYRTTGAVPLVFNAEPEQTKQLVSNVVPDPANPKIFRYYAFGAASGTTPAKPDVELTNPEPTAIGQIARIDIAFVTRAGSERATTTSDASLTLRTQVYLRAADPNDPAPYPTCV